MQENIQSRKDYHLFFAGIITGFTMGEGSFLISVSKSKTIKVGYQICPIFKINLKVEDKKILEDIRDYFQCGNVETHKNTVSYVVKKISDLEHIIIPFFEQYPLKNIKEYDFLLFKIICYKFINGENKTISGINRIMSVRNKMNNGGINRKISFL